MNEHPVIGLGRPVPDLYPKRLQFDLRQDFAPSGPGDDGYIDCRGYKYVSWWCSWPLQYDITLCPRLRVENGPDEYITEAVLNRCISGANWLQLRSADQSGFGQVPDAGSYLLNIELHNQPRERFDHGYPFAITMPYAGGEAVTVLHAESNQPPVPIVAAAAATTNIFSVDLGTGLPAKRILLNCQVYHDAPAFPGGVLNFAFTGILVLTPPGAGTVIASTAMFGIAGLGGAPPFGLITLTLVGSHVMPAGAYQTQLLVQLQNNDPVNAVLVYPCALNVLQDTPAP